MPRLGGVVREEAADGCSCEPARRQAADQLHGTRVEVGETRVWTGVPGNVDWREMEGARPSR